ncbi:MAG: hypothetical protein R3A47_02835 [Polyangiales bacterium]
MKTAEPVHQIADRLPKLTRDMGEMVAMVLLSVDFPAAQQWRLSNHRIRFEEQPLFQQRNRGVSK